MSVFHQVSLGDVLTFQRGFDITKNEQSDGHVPIVSSSGISSYHNKWRAKGPGVIIGRKGTLGTVHFLKSNYWPHDTTLWVKNFKGNEPRFLYYFLQTLKLENFDVGASNPTLNRNHLHKIKVTFPENIVVQKRIAAILSAYDDQIENNKRSVVTLERMVEEIYREWFVRMRFPGHEGTKFTKGLPEPWSIKPIGELCTKVTDGSHASPEFYAGGKPMASVKDMQSNGFSLKTIKTISEKDFESLKRADCQPVEHDVLIAKDGSYLKHVFVWDHGYEIVILSSIAILRPNLKRVLPYFLSLVLKQSSTKSMMSGYVSGSALPRIILSDFKKMKLLVPDFDLISRFENVVKPYYHSMRLAAQQIDQLQICRDMLLPRLISGRLSVEKLDIEPPPNMAEELKFDSSATAYA